ncbi:MAG: glycosyltransferase family 2 protein [Frankia sp.]
MLISVVVPVYNGEEFIRQAVESVLGQEGVDLELVVVDDGSLDDTVKIVTGYSDPRVRLVTQSRLGVAAARNQAIKEAKGDVIAFLDHDDRWLPGKLSIQLAMLQTPGVAAVGCLMNYINAKGRLLGTAGEFADNRQQDIAASRFMPFPISSLITWRTLALEVGGFDEELPRHITPVDDLDFVAKLATKGVVKTAMMPFGQYRIHSGSASVNHFFAMRKATRYLQGRTEARRQGADLSWTEFCENFKPSAKERIGDYTRYFYRSGGLAVASKQYPKAAMYIAAAFLLGPRYTVRRLDRQIFRKKPMTRLTKKLAKRNSLVDTPAS